MPENQKFGNSVFGGFKKKDVIKYINEIIVGYEKEVEKIKVDSNIVIEELKRNLKEEKILCDEYKHKISQLEHNIDEYDENVEELIEEKDRLLGLQERKNLELEKKIERLEKDLQKYKKDKENEEEKFKTAQEVVREKVNNIIKKGKAQILDEYNEKAQKWEEEKVELKKAALREVSTILNNAAARISNFNSEVKKEIEAMLNMSKEKAKSIVDSAKIVADFILKESAKIAFKQFSNIDDVEYNLCEEFDFKLLDETVKQEVVDAINKLKNYSLFKENEGREELTGGF